MVQFSSFRNTRVNTRARFCRRIEGQLYYKLECYHFIARQKKKEKNQRYSPNADRLQKVEQVVIKNQEKKKERGNGTKKKFHSNERGFLEGFLGTQLRKQQYGMERKDMRMK